jgi:hypothetical protein
LPLNGVIEGVVVEFAAVHDMPVTVIGAPVVCAKSMLRFPVEPRTCPWQRYPVSATHALATECGVKTPKENMIPSTTVMAASAHP